MKENRIMIVREKLEGNLVERNLKAKACSVTNPVGQLCTPGNDGKLFLQEII